jgi:hypothetical protein
MLITRKIELWVDGEDKAKRSEVWSYLRKLNTDVFHAANLIVSNQYFNESFKQRIILTDAELKVKAKKADEEIKKLTEAMKQSVWAKKLLHLWLAMMLLILHSFCFSQNADSTKKINLVLKADILLPAINMGIYHKAEFSFTAEKLFNKRHSFQLTFVSFGNSKTTETRLLQGLVSNEHQLITNSIAVIPEYKFFVSKKKNYTGYYIGVSAAYILQSYKSIVSDNIPAGVSFNNTMGPATLSYHYQDNFQGLAIGIINGFQYYVFKHLVLDFIAGGGIAWVVDSQGFNSSQFIWRLALNVGYRF